jgi:hypothetical protein
MPSADSRGRRTLLFSRVRRGEVSFAHIQTRLLLMEVGTEYGVDDIFDLTKMEPYNLEKLYKSFTKISKELVLYLPRTSDLNQIARYGQEGKKLEVAHYAMMGASKVWMTACM